MLHCQNKDCGAKFMYTGEDDTCPNDEMPNIFEGNLCSDSGCPDCGPIREEEEASVDENELVRYNACSTFAQKEEHSMPQSRCFPLALTHIYASIAQRPLKVLTPWDMISLTLPSMCLPTRCLRRQRTGTPHRRGSSLSRQCGPATHPKCRYPRAQTLHWVRIYSCHKAGQPPTARCKEVSCPRLGRPRRAHRAVLCLLGRGGIELRLGRPRRAHRAVLCLLGRGGIEGRATLRRDAAALVHANGATDA
jgi:hypothetical protein